MFRLLRFLAVVLLASALTATSTVLIAPAVGAVFSAGDSEKSGELELGILAERSVVLAADGSVIAVLHEDENRLSIPLEEVPDVLIDTVLAVEDEDFYRHDGVNVRATLRAFLSDVSAGDVRQGGSTITQQLAKNIFLIPEGGVAEQDIDRKLKEAVLARRLEEQLTKDEILERYLNTVYLGNGTYGVQAAAEYYYGVPASELDVAGSAFLTALIRNPEGYNPLKFPELATERRDLVVDRLVTLGQIEEAAGEALKQQPVPTERRDIRPTVNYFVEEVERRLLLDTRLGETQQERYNALFRGGLTIKTTLDPRLQALADWTMATTLPDTGGAFTGSIVSVEPTTGAVRSLVGGPGFEQNEYNIATQGVGRQPGSSFKPFILAAAIDQGISPESTINGSGPCRFDEDDNPYFIEELFPEGYEVENYEGSRGGTYDLYGVTKRSLNCAYARLNMIVGFQTSADMAARLGITTPVEPIPSLALGTEEVYPLDMASAYATFAADGVRHAPYFVEEVLDRDGQVVFDGRTPGEQVISADVARTVTDVLRGVVDSGTGTRARLPGRMVAGKTGTTDDSADAWFVGYTPQLATAVWMGSSVGRVPMRGISGLLDGTSPTTVAAVTGGTFPARIWHAFMAPALEGAPVMDFAGPPEPEYGTYLRLPNERTSRSSGRRPSSPATAPTTAPAAPPPTAPPPPPPPPPPPTTAPPEDQSAPSG